MRNFKRTICALFAVMTIAVTLCFGAVSASASAAEPMAAPAVATVVNPMLDNTAITNAAISLPAVPNFEVFKMEDKKATLKDQTDGETEFKELVEFFVDWIKRIGLLVAFVGAIMFALAIKNNDADQKQNGLLTMVAGFVVAALCAAVDMFGITSV
jgi:hypothetical protein